MRSRSLRVCLSWALLWGSTVGASSRTSRAVQPQSAADSNARIFKREERNGINYNIYEHAATNSTLSFVQDSGICETTPGVTTYSGYLSVGTNMSMFFWFFEARNNPSTAPLALWLNGGPGCSSMIGLFQENGPCNFPVNGSTDEPTLNPYSWNNYAVSDKAVHFPVVMSQSKMNYRSITDMISQEYALRRSADWNGLQLRNR